MMGSFQSGCGCATVSSRDPRQDLAAQHPALRSSGSRGQRRGCPDTSRGVVLVSLFTFILDWFAQQLTV